MFYFWVDIRTDFEIPACTIIWTETSCDLGFWLQIPDCSFCGIICKRNLKIPCKEKHWVFKLGKPFNQCKHFSFLLPPVTWRWLWLIAGILVEFFFKVCNFLCECFDILIQTFNCFLKKFVLLLLSFQLHLQQLNYFWICNFSHCLEFYHIWISLNSG